MRRRDLAAAVVLLAFGIFAVTQARGLRFGTLVSPGPGFFPLCLAAALCLTSVGLLVQALRSAPTITSVPVSAAHRLAVTGTLAALLVYALVLERLGFLVATFILLLVFFKGLQHQSWLVAVGGSVATSLLSYLVFRVWLGVNLPDGLFRF